MATRPIDEKIVAMKMDNSDFIKKASETTKSMGALTNFLNKIPGINFGRTTSQLENIQKSVNGIETSRLANAIDTVTSRFSTLGVVGTTALVNITNRVVDASIALARKITIAPVMDGFREYELQMGSIQTILANTSKYGTTVGDVTKSLGELNHYADKTIYNFGEMTKNIGLFTNAGLELEESVSMIKGFSNAAAASGANAENAARAAYQLSQGLSQGFLMQMDWMSLTNAGMGNDNMKRDLIALGQAMGTLTVDTETAIRDWKTLLSDEQWLTTDVMSTYLRAMAGELDMATLKTVGLSDAQAKLLLQNAKTGEQAATYVRTFTQMLTTLVEGVGSGWAESWRIMFGGFEEGTKLWSGFSKLVSEPFNRLTESRNKFLNTLKDNGVFEELFVGIGTAIYIVGKAINAMSDGFDKAFSSDKVGIVSSLVKGFKSIVAALTPSEESLNKISTIFQAVGSNVRVFMTILGKVGEALFKLVPDNLGTGLLSILEKIAKLNISFNDAILNSEGLKFSFDTLSKVFSGIGSGIGSVINDLLNFGDRAAEVWAILRTGEAVTNGVFDKDSKIVTWLVNISEAAESVIDSITSIELSMAPIKRTFDGFISAIGTGFNWLKEKLAGTKESVESVLPSGTTLLAGGFVAALATVAGIVWKTIYDISQIFSGWGNVVDGFGETMESVSGTLDAFALNIHAQSLLIAAFAVGALAGSIFLLSKIDGSKIGTSLTAIVGSLMAVIGGLAIINKYNISGGFAASASIIGVAIAISIMSGALKKFGALKPEELTKGLISLSVIMASIAGSFALMGKFSDKEVAVTAAQIVAMSVSVMLIAKAVQDMGSMNMSELAKGIGGLATIIVAISSAFALMGKFAGKGASASALQFVAIAGSVLILVGAIKMISNIDTADLLIGLTTITAILGVVAGFAALTSGTGLLATSVGLLAISVAMHALLIPILALGNFPIDNLIVGLLGMSGALLAIAAASKVMNGSLIGAASITVMAVALNLLLVPIGAFAAMGWGPMLIGVAGLALSLGALAAVSLLLSPATIPLLGFSAAIGIMGIAMLAAGAGMTLFSTGLLALAGMTSAAITTIIATIGALVTGIASLMPTVVKFVGDILLQIIKVIRDKSPEIIDTIVSVILMILGKIAHYLPHFVRAAVKIITALLDGIASEAPKLIDSVVNLLITMVETMAETIDKHGPRFINAFLGLMESILTIMVQAGTSTIKALYGWVPGINKAMDDIATSATKTIEESLQTARIAETKGSEFASGLKSKEFEVKTAATGLSRSAALGLNSLNSKSSGQAFATNFASGILSRKDDVTAASSQLAGAAANGTSTVLRIKSPSKVGIEQGGFYGEGVAIGISNSSGKVETSAANMASAAGSGLKGVTDKVRGILFINDSDVKEQENKAVKVGDSYSNVGKSITSASNSATKTQVDNSKKVQDVLAEQFAKSKEWIDDQKYYQKLSLDEELKAWKDIQKQYKEGTEQRKQADREVFRVEMELIKQKEEAEKAAFNHSKQWISDRKYYNELSLSQELAAWERVQARYLAGTEERKEADREVYRLKNELIKKELEHSKKWIADRKYYNELSLADELAAWERVQARYKAGSEERKEADREVYRLKNELNKQLIQLNDEYVSKVRESNRTLIEEERRLTEDYNYKVNEANQRLLDDELRLKEDYERSVKEVNDRLISEERRLTEEYNKAVDDRMRSLVNFAGLFDAVPKKSKVSGQQLIDNLKGQVDSFSSWSDSISALAERGIDEGLLSELRDMGPKASGEIEALNSLTDEQLTEYSELWKSKNELARTQAISELETLKQDTNSKIEELRLETGIQLEALKNEWLSKTNQLRVQTAAQLEAYKNDWLTKTEELRAQTALLLEAYKGEWLNKISELSEGTKEQFIDLSTDMQTIGEDSIKGMISGMEDMEGPLMDQAKSMAEAVASTIKSALKIKSPSKVTEALGAFTGEGLAYGLASQVRNVADKAKELALTAKESLNKFLDGFGLPEDDNEIRIKAVVVWDGVDPTDLNAKPLRIMPNSSFTNGMIGEVRASQSQNGSITLTDANKDSQVVTKEVKIDQHLTFNSRELTPSEVARKNLQVSRQLAMQWG